MFLLRNTLALMVTAGIGLGTLAGTDAGIRSKVRVRTQEAAQAVTHLAAQVRSEWHIGSPDVSPDPDRLQTQTEERQRSQNQVGADDAPGAQLETQTQFGAEVRNQNQTGEGSGQSWGAGQNDPGRGNAQNGR
jgi:hypothetical protein